MIEWLLDRLRGTERLRQRADRYFLAGEFVQAERLYLRARASLGRDDHRRVAIDSLIASCERLARHEKTARLTEAGDGSHSRTKAAASAATTATSPSAAAVEGPSSDDFVPGLDDFFELAIADKPGARARDYRMQGQAFRAGYVALLQGTAERSVRLLSQAASESSAGFVVQLELGRALSMAERFEEAREALRSAERSRPEDREAVVLLAAVNIELGRFEEARAALEGLISDARGAPDAGPEAVFLLGKALSGEGREAEALARLKQTAELEPRFHEAFYEAGRLRERQGDIDAAFELYHRASGLAPDDVSYNRALVELVLAHGLDVEAGLAACDRLMMTDLDNRWQYLSWIADLYLRRGWRREARDPLQKALELVPSDKKAERIAIEQRLGELGALGSGGL